MIFTKFYLYPQFKYMISYINVHLTDTDHANREPFFSKMVFIQEIIHGNEKIATEQYN